MVISHPVMIQVLVVSITLIIIHEHGAYIRTFHTPGLEVDVLA